MVANTPAALLSPALTTLPSLMLTTPTRPEIGAVTVYQPSCDLRCCRSRPCRRGSPLAWSPTAVLALSRLSCGVADARDEIGVARHVALRSVRAAPRPWRAAPWRPASWASRLARVELISTSPALTSAPSATSTLSTVASKCGRSATLAIACAVPISSIFQGRSLRAAWPTTTDTGGRRPAAAFGAATAAEAAGQRSAESHAGAANGAGDGQNAATATGS